MITGRRLGRKQLNSVVTSRIKGHVADVFNGIFALGRRLAFLRRRTFGIRVGLQFTCARDIGKPDIHHRPGVSIMKYNIPGQSDNTLVLHFMYRF